MSYNVFHVVRFHRGIVMSPSVWNSNKKDSLGVVSPFQLFIAFHTETSHLIGTVNQRTGFNMKCSTGLNELRDHPRNIGFPAILAWFGPRFVYLSPCLSGHSPCSIVCFQGMSSLNRPVFQMLRYNSDVQFSHCSCWPCFSW